MCMYVCVCPFEPIAISPFLFFAVYILFIFNYFSYVNVIFFSSHSVLFAVGYIFGIKKWRGEHSVWVKWIVAQPSNRISQPMALTVTEMMTLWWVSVFSETFSHRIASDWRFVSYIDLYPKFCGPMYLTGLCAKPSHIKEQKHEKKRWRNGHFAVELRSICAVNVVNVCMWHTQYTPNNMFQNGRKMNTQTHQKIVNSLVIPLMDASKLEFIFRQMRFIMITVLFLLWRERALTRSHLCVCVCVFAVHLLIRHSHSLIRPFISYFALLCRQTGRIGRIVICISNKSKCAF